jgi:hypothetical protein
MNGRMLFPPVSDRKQEETKERRWASQADEKQMTNQPEWDLLRLD